MKIRSICKFLIFLLPAAPQVVVAQSNVSVAAGGGIMFYNGDLSDQSFIPPMEIIKPFYGADVSLLLIDRLDLSLRYIHGSVKGDDALSDEADNLARNQSFTSTIDEASLLLRLRLFGVWSQRTFNPYLLAGFGYFKFNPQAELNGKTYDLQPLGTEGQYIPGGGYPSPYKLNSSSLAYGVGLFIRVNNQWGVRLEAAPQLTFTDYLDDTSTKYPDSLALLATPNGPTAVHFSSKRPRGWPPGRPRGNPDKDDVIATIGISIVYTPASRRSGPGSKPGVFNQMFKGRRGWWGETPH